ncbi:MAG: hypothetical protein JZU47_10795 [Prolixibacteraceae bacterium]|nr:hypothetical protein [Prolixibacteraceae bacterium]
MKKYLFIRESDGAKIYGDTDGSLNTGGYRVEPNKEKTRVTVYDRLNRDSAEASDLAVGDFLKENGEPYANYAELDSAFAAFFFNVSGSGNPFLPIGNFRIISTEDGLRIDKKLTELGFSGAEFTDWEILNIFN